MDCLSSLSQLILTCLIQGTYLSAGIEAELDRPAHEGRWCGTAARRWPDNGYCTGSMGVISLGSQLELTRAFDLDLGFTHSSFINTRRDAGVETAYLTITWRPFRH